MTKQKIGFAVAIICIAGCVGGCTYCAALLATYLATRMAAGLNGWMAAIQHNRYCLQGEKI